MAGSADAEDGPSTLRAARRALLALRLGIGVIWTLNLVYVLLPANSFFPAFADTASSFGPTTLSGPGIATYVASHSGFFSVGVAVVTAYLAAAFLLGASTKVACLVGAGFNVTLLVTQFGQIAMIPGATDVGPQPLYLAIYVALFLSAGIEPLSMDRWFARARLAASRRYELTAEPAPAG